MKLEGVITPLITPLEGDGTLDQGALIRLVEHGMRGGIHGVFIAGSCGEGTCISADMRRQAALLARQVAQDNVKVLVGVLEQSTAAVIREIKQLEQDGFDCFVVAPPYYLKYETQGEIIRHYEAVHNAIETELVIYNIPQFAGTCIAPKTLVELSNLERVVSIKDSNPNWEAVQNVLLLKRDHGFSYLVGNEDNGAPGMLFGGDGCVPCLGNIYPKLFVDLYEAAKRGDVELVFELQGVVTELRNILRHATAWISGIKYIASLNGLCDDTPAVPIQPLSCSERAIIGSSIVDFHKKHGRRVLSWAL